MTRLPLLTITPSASTKAWTSWRSSPRVSLSIYLSVCPLRGEVRQARARAQKREWSTACFSRGRSTCKRSDCSASRSPWQRAGAHCPARTIGRHRSMVKATPRQRPSSVPLRPQGAPGGSGQLITEPARPLGAQPLPLPSHCLCPATAFDHSGKGAARAAHGRQRQLI